MLSTCDNCGGTEHTPTELRECLDSMIYQPECPACGEPIDYCMGHGEIGDPYGYAILQAHYYYGDHSNCAKEACDVL